MYVCVCARAVCHDLARGASGQWKEGNLGGEKSETDMEITWGRQVGCVCLSERMLNVFTAEMSTF